MGRKGHWIAESAAGRRCRGSPVCRVGGIGIGHVVVLVLLACVVLSACSTHKPAPVTSRENTGPPVTDGQGYYRVGAGDTLYAIAWRAGLDYHQIARWNGIRSPYTIYVGQRLRLKPPTASKTKRSGSSRSVAKSASGKPATRSATTRRKTTPRPVKSAKTGPPATTKTRSLRWQWPTNGKIVERFSKRDETKKGLKISGHTGQTIRAAESGKIVYSGSGLRGYGRLIIIKHDKNYLSAYGHNRKILVKEGDAVTKGERIAEMGTLSDGRPVLHFEIRRDGTPVDPVALLPKQR